jgi:hypothetical protein
MRLYGPRPDPAFGRPARQLQRPSTDAEASSMFRSVRPLFFFLFILTFLIAGASTGKAAHDQIRITAAANVTVRTLPAADSPAVAQVPLGTELTDSSLAGLDKTWIRVTLADGREGWILATLTKPLDPQWRWPTFDGIIADRLARKGDKFPALAELAAFIERVAPEYTDPDGRARVEFARLRAIALAAGAIPFQGGTREPYASWLTARGTDIAYDEPGGRWMLRPRSIWETHARIQSASIADDVAWLAVNNGLGGECEGYLVCYFDRRNRLHGEYLRHHPNGQHAADAVAVLKETADEIAAPAKTSEAFQFDRGRDCREVTASLDALTAAVTGTRVGIRDATIASVAALRRLCQ